MFYYSFPPGGVQNEKAEALSIAAQPFSVDSCSRARVRNSGPSSCRSSRGLALFNGITYSTIMSNAPQVVLDTNVIYAGLRSRRGASFKLLSLLGSGRFKIHLSVPLVLEYEEVLRKKRRDLGLTAADVNDVLDYLCQVAGLHEIHYLWRPRLKDPDDEMLLELAVVAGCEYIVTYNKEDFPGVEQFSIQLATAKELLQHIGTLP